MILDRHSVFKNFHSEERVKKDAKFVCDTCGPGPE